MADTQTTNLLLTNQTEGANNNTWGTIADANFEELDDVLGDTTSISTTGGDTTLTTSQENVAIIDVSGTLVSNVNIIFSGRGGFWIIRNQATAGDYTVTCKVSGQTGVVVDAGLQKLVFCDGTDIALGNTTADAADEDTVASASTCNILGSESEFVAISGTTTITSFGTGTNRKRFVRATGNFTLTHNATSLILPGAQNIGVKSGDTFLVVSDASSNARVHNYQRSGQPPSSIPVGAIMDFAGSSAPDFWLFAYGQELSRTEHAPLFAVIGTTYGVGDASTTFNAPDLRGRVRCSPDNMGGTDAGRLGAILSNTIGSSGGSERVTLTSDEMPSHLHAKGTLGTTSDGTHSHDLNNIRQLPSGGGGGGAVTYGTGSGTTPVVVNDGLHDHDITGNMDNTGGGDPHSNIQPTIIIPGIIYAGV